MISRKVFWELKHTVAETENSIDLKTSRIFFLSFENRTKGECNGKKRLVNEFRASNLEF